MTGTVSAISRSATHTMVKGNSPTIRLVVGLGVEGDAHSGETVKHRSRVARDPNQPNLRQVHLIHAELHDELRITRNDFTMIGRLLDEGMLGIVVPMVHTVEDARAAAAACRFPPVGTRSWGWAHASIYGDDYPNWINEQIFLAVQIESAQAVENAEAIMAVPGVDGCWVGPADLALSMGIHPRDAAKNESHQRALERVIAACRDTGTIPGFAANTPEEAVRRAEQGFRYLTAGSDSGFLLDGASAGLKTLGLA